MNYDINKNQDYDAWLHWYVIYGCNLKCNYCFNRNQSPPSHFFQIKISSLIKCLSNTNKTFKINFTGVGEPFLISNIVEACQKITENHFISFQTNLTSVKIKKFADIINPRKVSFMIASLHIKELERTHLLERFISNFLLCKEKGFNIEARVVAYPPLLTELKNYINLFKEKGIKIAFDPFRGMYKESEYPKAYTEEELKFFKLNKDHFKIHQQKHKLCNAGYNVGVVQPNGDIFCCDKIHKPIGNIYQEIKFNTKLIQCPFKYCECPLNAFDIKLFNNALLETQSQIMNPIFLRQFLIKQTLQNLGIGYFKNSSKLLNFLSKIRI